MFLTFEIFSMEVYSGINDASSLATVNLRDEEFRGVYLTHGRAISYENMLYFRKQKILRTKEHMQMLPMTILLRKYSCLRRSFDFHISALRTSGLIDYWEEIYPDAIKKIEDKKSEKLKIGQIVGVIEVCGVLYTISLLIFILELMTLKHGRIKTFIDFFAFK